MQIQTWLWVLDIPKCPDGSLYILRPVPTQNQAELDSDLDQHSSLIAFGDVQSRVLVQVHLGENIRKDLSRAASRGTGSKTGGILLLSLSFDKLAGSKRSCDQMTKQRNSFSLLIT